MIWLKSLFLNENIFDSYLVIREDKYDAYVNACGELADKENRYKLDFDGWMKFVPALFEDEKTQAEDMWFCRRVTKYKNKI